MNGPTPEALPKTMSMPSSSNIETKGINHQSFLAHRNSMSSPAIPILPVISLSIFISKFQSTGHVKSGLVKGMFDAYSPSSKGRSLIWPPGCTP